MDVGGSRTSTTAASIVGSASAATSAGPLSTASTTSKPWSVEDPGQADPEEGLVLGEDNAHGTSMVTTVGPPTGLDTADRAVEGRQPPAHPRQTAAGRVGAAPAVVAHHDLQTACRRARAAPRRACASACLTTLVRHSATAK